MQSVLFLKGRSAYRCSEKVHSQFSVWPLEFQKATYCSRKICFSKIGLGHILDIAILHQCAKFHEKILSTAREIQEIPFFRRFLQSSSYNNQFNWQMNHAWWWTLLWIMFVTEKKKRFKEKVRTKSAKTVISGIFGRKKSFLKNWTRPCFEHC